jgi:hypothetical protein
MAEKKVLELKALYRYNHSIICNNRENDIIAVFDPDKTLDIFLEFCADVESDLEEENPVWYKIEVSVDRNSYVHPRILSILIPENDVRIECGFLKAGWINEENTVFCPSCGVMMDKRIAKHDFYHCDTFLWIPK